MVHSNRPTTENYNNNIYFIALQIYTLPEDRLFSQSIRSGRDAISAMQYSTQVPSQSLSSTYNRDLLHSSSNIHALRGSLIESINSIWQRRHFIYAIFNTTMQYLTQVPSQSLSSTYSRDLLHTSSNIYTLSEDRLLSQSIRSGRDAIQLCNIQYM
ncbi:hypothetical protein GIB67_035300, partial [Kingdonia uniflora]